jgi:hypothetical protein
MDNNNILELEKKTKIVHRLMFDGFVGFSSEVILSSKNPIRINAIQTAEINNVCFLILISIFFKFLLF